MTKFGPIKTRGRWHEWPYIGLCIRCGAPPTDTGFCISDKELREREEWKEAAVRAAELMRRRGGGTQH